LLSPTTGYSIFRLDGSEKGGVMSAPTLLNQPSSPEQQNMVSRPTQTPRVAGAVLLCCVFLLLVVAGCHTSPLTNPTGDTTPPVFVQGGVTVQLEAPTPPNPQGAFDITSQDASPAGKLASSLHIRVKAVAGDIESGIKDISTVSNLSWQCSSGSHSPTIGVPQVNTTMFTPGDKPASPATPWAINVVADPIATTGCSTAKNGWGPVNIEGFVRVIATNGVGLTVTSKTFIFDYKDVGTK